MAIQLLVREGSLFITWGGIEERQDMVKKFFLPMLDIALKCMIWPTQYSLDRSSLKSTIQQKCFLGQDYTL